MLKSLLALGVATSAALFFHTELKSSVPTKNQVLHASPAKVALTFTEKVILTVSTISIQKPDSTVVEKLAVKATSDPATIEASLAKPLAPGRYLVRWKTGSDDGHAVRGVYSFSISATK